MITVGLNAHLPGRRVLERLSAANVQHVRLDAVPGHLDTLRDAVRLCDLWGIEPLVVLDNALSIDAVQRLVRSLAELKTRQAWRPERISRAYCIGNEPNLRRFWNGPREAWMARVADRSRVIVRADPAAVIVGPDLAHVGSADWPEWLGRFLDWWRTGDLLVDVLGHHVYGSSWRKASARLQSRWPCRSTLRRELRRGGWDGPVWITETGLPAVGDDEEMHQAQYLHDVITDERLARWVERVYVYEAVDDPTENVPKFGLLETDLQPKLAWQTMRRAVGA